MKYENFKEAEAIVKKIDQKTATLKELMNTSSVSVLCYNNRVCALNIEPSDETDDKYDALAESFLQRLIEMHTDDINELKAKLETL